MNSDYTTQADAVFIAVDSVKGLSASQTFVVKQKNHEVVKDNTGSYFVMPAIDSDGNVTTVKVDAKSLGDDGQKLDNVGTTQVTSVVSMSDVTKNSDDIITGASFDVSYTGNGDNGVNGDFKTGQSYYKTTGVVAPLNGVIGVGDDDKTNAAYWAYTKDTKFYSVNEDMNAITVISASDIVTDANDVIFFVADDDATASYKVVKTVIVQKVAPPAPTAYYALPAVTGAQWSVDGGSTWVAANAATTAASGASIKLKFATAPASIVVTLSDDSVQATTESPAGTYSFTMPAKAVKSVTVTPKDESAYDGTIVVDYSTDASVGSSTDPFVAKVITYIGEDAPTEDQVVDAIIAAFQEDYPTYTNIDSSAYPVLKFTAKYGSLYVTCADSSIAAPAEGTAVADAAGLTAFLSGVAGTAVLTASVETSETLTANHPVIVPDGITLTLDGNNAVQSNGKISGEGKVIIKTGDITGNANIEVADVEIQGGSIDGVPAGMNLKVTGDAELKGANAAGSTITVSENKTLTVSGSTALGADITGAGNVTIAASSTVTGGEHIKVSGDVTISDTGSIDTLPNATGNINVDGDVTIATSKSVKIATGKTLTIATGKTLTLIDAAATGLDGAIAGAGKLVLSAGGAVNDITAALENTSGALTIKGTAAPSALTWTAGKITVTSTGNLTLPATTTSVHADGLEISGTVKLSGDLAVNGSASNIDIKATGVLDLNGKNLTGAASATIAVAGGAQIKNVTGAKFYTDTTLATADITVPASGVSSYTYGTDYGTTSDQTGWKATA